MFFSGIIYGPALNSHLSFLVYLPLLTPDLKLNRYHLSDILWAPKSALPAVAVAESAHLIIIHSEKRHLIIQLTSVLVWPESCINRCVPAITKV